MTLAASAALVTSAGKLTLTAQASDDVHVKKVVFRQDGVQIGEVRHPPFVLRVGVTSALNGRRHFTATAYDEAGNRADSTDVQVLVAIGNRFFGTAVGQPEDYAFPAFSTYFDQVTPDNAGKWGTVEATQGTMVWDGLDAAYQFAKSNGYRFKLHTLVWGQQQPAWITTLPADQQLAAIDNWMAKLAERYPDLDLIDVVNEPLHAPPAYKDALGGDGATGWDWVIKVFEMARQHFPRSELLLNDYNIVILPQFTQQYLQLIHVLQDRGLIDGIGEQGHFLERADTQVVKDDLAALAATGLPIYISELDLDFADDAQQANRMKELFTAFWENPSVLGVTHWGFREGAMWRENAFLVNADGTPRPALDWLHCYLNGGGGACTVPTYIPQPRTGDGFNLSLQAEEYDGAKGLIASGNQVAYTSDGSWLRFDRVVFQDNYDTLRIRYSKGNTTATSVTLHLDALDNPPIATADLASTGDWGAFLTTSVPLAVTAAGEHTLYVLFHGGADGAANLDWLELGCPLRTGGDDRLDVPAASYDAASGLTSDGTSITALAGGWAAYANVVVSKYTLFAASYTRAAGSAGTVTVHRGAVDGPVVASLDAPPTGGAPGQASAILDLGPGTYNLFVVFSDADMGQFQQFSLVKSDLGPNLVANGTFEAGTTGWSTWSAATLQASTDLAHGGMRSLLIANRTAAGDNAVTSLTGKVVTGRRYAAALYVSLRNATSAQPVHLTSKTTCDGTSSYAWLASADVPATAGAWTSIAGDFQIPATCTSLQEFLIYVEGPAGGVDVFVDDVSVQQRLGQNLISNPDFESGTTSGWYTWSGSLAVSTDRAHGGKYSLVTAAGGLAATDLKSLVTPGKSYPVSLWVTVGQAGGTAPASAVHMTSAIQCSTDANPTYSWFINPVTVTDGTWTNLTGTLAVPACTGGTLTQLQIYVEGPAAPVQIYLDDVSVTGN